MEKQSLCSRADRPDATMTVMERSSLSTRMGVEHHQHRRCAWLAEMKIVRRPAMITVDQFIEDDGDDGDDGSCTPKLVVKREILCPFTAVSSLMRVMGVTIISKLPHACSMAVREAAGHIGIAVYQFSRSKRR